MRGRQRIAHFLLHDQLLDSPPNAALFECYANLGFEVDVFAPAWGSSPESSSLVARRLDVAYRSSWILKNAPSSRWRKYALFSATSEAPIPVASALARRSRRPLVILADEIHSGSYRGDLAERWKRWAQAAMRSCALVIVNDESRVSLLGSYAGRDAHMSTIVYPAVYPTTPLPDHRSDTRESWGCRPSDFVALASGGLNETAGLPWLIQATTELPWLRAVLQATTINPMVRSLLPHLRAASQVHVASDRIPWRRCWSQAVGADVALAIYHNPAPQFRAMGISSNRLCMALSMGVPVIASRQASFDFLDEYEAGVQVGGYKEFLWGLERIRSDPERYRAGARACAAMYLEPARRFKELAAAIESVLGRGLPRQ